MAERRDLAVRMVEACFWLVDRSRLKDVVGSSSFRSALSRRRESWRHGPETPDGAILRADPLFARTLLNSLSVEETVSIVRGKPAREENEDETLLVALLQALGAKLIADCQRRLTPELRELATEFRQAAAADQRVLCGRLHDMLRARQRRQPGESGLPDPLRHALEDIDNQPMRRVVPRQFMAFERGGNPNCFGKAQIVLAWAREAGAEVLGVTPLLSKSGFVNSILGRLSPAIEELAEEAEITLHDRLAEALLTARSSELLAAEVPDYFHMGVALRLGDGSWYLVDPHQDLHGEFSGDSWRLTEAAELLRRFGACLPGLTQVRYAPEHADLHLSKKAGWCGEPMDVARRISRRAKRVPDRTRALFSGILMSPAVDMLLEEIQQSAESREMVQAAKENRLYIKLPILFRDPDQPERRLPPELELRARVAFVLLDSFTDQRLLSCLANHREQGDELLALVRAGCERALSGLCAVARNRFYEVLTTTEAGIPTVHPAVEVYEPEYRAGCELLWHLNARSKQSEGIVGMLAELCGGQLELLAAALAPLRAKEATDYNHELAEIAAANLRMLPLRTPSVERALQLLDGYRQSAAGAERRESHA